MGRSARTAITLAGAWALALAVNRSLRRVQGSSMAPTLHAGQLLLTVPVSVPRRGDVVVLRDPRNATHVQVKRVVGLPGEAVELRGGTLLLDGRRYREAHRHGRGPDAGVVVPPDHVAVLGDARDASTDSRTYGPVPLHLVDRRAVAVLRPWPRRLRSVPVLHATR